MAIFRLNHAVLYVRNLAESVSFYTEVLGFRAVGMTPDGATKSDDLRGFPITEVRFRGQIENP